MRAAVMQHSAPEVRIRTGTAADLGALIDLENRVFATDRMSRRSLRHFLTSPTAAVIVAEHAGRNAHIGRIAGGDRIADGDRIAGCAVVLFRPSSAVARLYSIAVDPRSGGCGIGPALLDGAEQAVLAHDCVTLRLEVHENNARAIARYRKAGYREFGRHHGYYADKGDALRFEKRLVPRLRGLAEAPPYFHQTTDFTCGSACMMMALAWADGSFRPSPACEFELWREASTIFLTSGMGGCEPYGLAVTLKRRGLSPEIYVSRRGPYFVDTVHQADRKRVMRLTQEQFRHDAEALAIPTHLTPPRESVLMAALGQGAAAIVLVAGYHMVRLGVPHWVFAFGREGRYVLVHDPAAIRDDQGIAAAAETYAVPWTAFARMTRYGRDKLSAAILIRKGAVP
jgi:ribosomal protein S18 acetylase RimI-like enzyme